MHVLAGSWPHKSRVEAKKTFTGRLKYVRIWKSWLSNDDIPAGDIVSAQILTTDQLSNTGDKVGGAVAGGILFGGFGAVVGTMMAENVSERLVAVQFKDGRKALIKGTTKEVESILAAGFH